MQSPDVAAGREEEDVRHDQGQGEQEHVEQDVDHGPGEDPLAQVLAAAAGVAEAAVVAHREGPGVTVTLSGTLHTTTL